MFSEFSAQVWTPSSGSVTVENNTDTSIDGSCKQLEWSDALDETVTFSFDEVDLSSYEEISLYIFMSDLLEDGNVFKMTIDGNDYNFTRSDFRRNFWNHILFDCSEMGSVSYITFTSLVDNLILFVDYAGYRKVSYDCDIDVILALKSHINLDYDVSTTLSESVSAGDSEISLTSGVYITDSTMLEIDNGLGTVETVQLITRDGDLADELSNSFSSGDEVRAICPIRGEDLDSLEPDPICGIMVYDLGVDKDQVIIKAKNNSKVKEFLGTLGILIYIDCSSKKKLLMMSREFNKKYGKEFSFLLDGERVEIYLDSMRFTDSVIGNNPRMAYYYLFEPQPYLLANVKRIDSLTLTVDSEEIQ